LNTEKVMWTLGELGLEHRQIDIGGPFGKNKEPEYLAKNPNGFVPTLEDGSLTLWESNAILRHLVRRHGSGRLMPADPDGQALVDQWMDWQVSVVAPAMLDVFLGLTRHTPAERNQAAVEASTKRTIAAMTILDAALSRSTYVACGEFTIADVALGVSAWRYRQLVPERPPLTALERWYGAISSRPAFAIHVAPFALRVMT
jgi:glutathione S-transferase